MLDSITLVVTRDRSLVAVLREQVRSQKVVGSRIIVCASADEACSLLQSVQVRLVLVHLEPEYVGYDEVDHILWVLSTLSRRIPLVVVAERYLVEQATTFYHMGVSEYVSRSHHLDQLGALAAAYLPHRPAAPSGSGKDLPAEKPARVVAASAKPSAAIRAGAV
jgi:DNA-binding NtrC family response regulator